MSITVTPTTSAVGIKAGFGPGASNTNSWVPIGIGPVESSSSWLAKILFCVAQDCPNIDKTTVSRRL